MKRLFIASGIVVGLLSGSALASDLLGVDSGGDGTHKFDQGTGASGLIGPNGYDFIGDLTSDTRAGSERVWGTDLTTNTLVRIDPTNGAGSPVGVFTAPNTIVSLAFDITTGKMYGTTSLGFGDADGDDLYEIDPGTGAAMHIGALGINDVWALCFDNAGKLYGVGNGRQALFTISTLDGSVGLVAELPGMIFDIATRPEDGVTFMVNSSTNTLSMLDLTNGATNPVGLYTAGNVVGLAFIPEPATVGLLILGGLLAVRRRNK